MERKKRGKGEEGRGTGEERERKGRGKGEERERKGR